MQYTFYYSINGSDLKVSSSYKAETYQLALKHCYIDIAKSIGHVSSFLGDNLDSLRLLAKDKNIVVYNSFKRIKLLNSN